MGRATRAALPWWVIGLSAVVALQAGVFADGTHSIFDDNWTPTPSTPVSPTPKPSPTREPAPTPTPAPTPAPEHNPPTPAPKQTGVKPAPVTPAPTPIAKTPAVTPAPATPTSTKFAPPDVARQAETMKLVKEVFQKEYAEKAPAAKKELAQALVGEAVKIKENYVARYVLLNEGYKAALAASDVEDCKTAIDNFDKYYTVDATAMIIDTFAKLSSGPNGQNADLANWGVEAVERMIADDDYAQVRKLARAVQASVPQDADASIRERLKAAEMLAGEFERVRPSMTKLKTTPDDPQANLAVGKFYCFSKHDWDRGLQMLARGSDPRLKDLARQDLVEPSDALAQYALAGQWWGKDKPLFPGMRERAIYWYKKSAPNLSGLQKVMAERRSTDAPPAEAETKTGGAKNMLGEMVDFSGAKAPSGIVKLSRTPYYTPNEVKPPFKLDMIVKTDSVLILRYERGYVEFNFDPTQTPVNFTDPRTYDEGGIVDSTALVPNQWTQITWIMTKDTTSIYVNGKERLSSRAKYVGLSGKLEFYATHSPVEVKSVTVVQAPGK
ncbi:MAG TPA: hypothetical protein VG326_04325 [Tepidisphaeraceae bacterium]|jgi:hypothetical protein|nr:hypothetical protein [Tepidisphaeraceae bacterium]